MDAGGIDTVEDVDEDDVIESDLNDLQAFVRHGATVGENRV